MILISKVVMSDDVPLFLLIMLILMLNMLLLLMMLATLKPAPPECPTPPTCKTPSSQFQAPLYQAAEKLGLKES